MSLNNLGLGLVFEAKDLATGVMGKVGGEFLHLSGASTEAGKSIKNSMRAFGVGIAVMGAGLGVLAVLDSTIGEAKEFGKAIDLVRTEVDEATFSNQAMRDITIDMGKSFGKLPKDEAEALYKAVALGANTASKATALMTATNQLAVAGNAELKTTMDAIGGSLNAYHLKASDAGMVSDAFFTAMKGGNTNVQDLAASVGRVSASAHGMGISIQEVLGAVSVMTNKGIQASEAVSYLHGALANIVQPSAAAGAEAARLGIKFNATAVRDGGGFVKFLHSITDNAKFSAKSLEKLFTSVEGGSAMAMLAGDMKSVDGIMKDMGNSAGATQKGFEIMTDGLSFQTDVLKANFSAAKIRIGEFLEPIEAGGIKILNKLLDTFTSMPPKIQGFIVHAALAAGVLLTVVGAGISAIAAFGLLSAGAAAAGISIGGVFTVLAPVVGIVALATLAFYAFRQAGESNLGGFGSFAKTIVADISLSFRALGQLFSSGGFSGDVLKELDAGNAGVERFAVNVYVWVNRIKNYFTGIGDGFSAGIAQARPAFDGFMTALDTLAAKFGFVTSAVDPLSNGSKFDAAGASGRNMGKLLAEAATMLVKLATGAIQVVTGITTLIDKLGGLDTILEVAKYAMIAFAAYGVASSVERLAKFGDVAIDAGASMASLVTKLISGQAVMSGGGFLSGISGLTSSAAAALDPVRALALALGALYLAWDQMNKLAKVWDENSFMQIATKLNHDLGFSSDAEFAAAQNERQGILTGDAYDKAHPTTIPQAVPIASMPQVNASVSVPDASAFPAGAQANGEANQSSATAGAISSLADATNSMATATASKPPPTLQGVVTLDDRVVGVLQSMQSENSLMSGGPGGSGPQ